MSLSDLSGQLHIRVTWRQGVIKHVSVRNTRPELLPSIFQGKPLTEVLRIIPILYSLCGVAQKIAALRASESALGIIVSPEVNAARNLLVQAEAVRELGIRLFTDWYSDDCGVKTSLMQWFSEIQKECNNALQVEPENPILPDVGMIAVELQSFLKPALGELSSFNRLNERLAHEIVKKLPVCVQELFLSKYKGLMDCEVPFLDASELETQQIIEQQLKGDGAFGFCAQPDFSGKAFENSAFAQSFAANGANSQREVNDFSPLVLRLYALIQAIISMPGKLKSGTSNCLVKTSSPGWGAVSAARGVLIHRIELQGNVLSDSVVEDYKIVAPTEWNFHPQGVFVKMLEGTEVTKQQLPLLVESLVKLIDPCVNWSLELETDNA